MENAQFGVFLAYAAPDGSRALIDRELYLPEKWAAGGKIHADQLAALVPAAGWQTLSCGDGAKGPRLYDWALIAAARPGHQGAITLWATLRTAQNI